VRIGVLTFYYPPDLCAGSFRAGALIDALRELAPSGTHIEVITTLPNRYQTFARESPELETSPGLTVRRIALPSHRSDMRGQSRAFMHNARGVRAAIDAGQYDLIFATSSRLMTAALGAWAARRKRVPLYLDIRDIFVDTIGDLLPGPVAFLARPPLNWLERWTMRGARRINLVSRGFEGYFRSRYPRASLSWYTNGVDDEFIAAAPSASRPLASSGEALILYAGNLGEGQGMHHVLPSLARALRGRARFIVIGDGGRRDALEQALKEAGTDNVTLRAPVSRERLLDEYQHADVLFLHLGAQAAFEKVLPSKLFEYAALGKPVLAGVAGFAAQFIREEISNAAVFPPGDVDAALKAFDSLKMEVTPRADFIARHGRARLTRSLAADLLSLVKS
jgi:glycosyltransferase involved in cell wall biosynthesis